MASSQDFLVQSNMQDIQISLNHVPHICPKARLLPRSIPTAKQHLPHTYCLPELFQGKICMPRSNYTTCQTDLESHRLDIYCLIRLDVPIQRPVNAFLVQYKHIHEHLSGGPTYILAALLSKFDPTLQLCTLID